MRAESTGNRPGPTGVPRAFRKPAAGGRPGSGRIRYAHGGALRPEPPVGGPRGDLWVLVCGGIAAAAAFAAAFVAAGGVASHPATPRTVMPAVVSQTCPAPSPAP
jgi:hypothetical protein